MYTFGETSLPLRVGLLLQDLRDRHFSRVACSALAVVKGAVPLQTERLEMPCKEFNQVVTICDFLPDWRKMASWIVEAAEARPRGPLFSQKLAIERERESERERERARERERERERASERASEREARGRGRGRGPVETRRNSCVRIYVSRWKSEATPGSNAACSHSFDDLNAFVHSLLFWDLS